MLWFAADVTLHRTRKDGGGDDELARTAWGGSLASDGRNLYWTRDARPRTALPTAHATDRRASRHAADRPGRRRSGHRIRRGARRPVLLGANHRLGLAGVRIDALERACRCARPPEAATAIAGSSRSFALAAAGAELLFLNQHDNWTVSLGRLAPSGEPQSVTVLQPYDSVMQVDVADGWLLATTMSRLDDSQTLRLVATPLAGGEPKIVAQGLRTAAIGAPAGIVYVDAAQGLVVLRPRRSTDHQPSAVFCRPLALSPALAARTSPLARLALTPTLSRKREREEIDRSPLPLAGEG